MPTSVWNGRVRGAVSLYGTDDDPVGVPMERDVLLNNAAHACDAMAQVRVNFFIPNGFTGGHTLYLTQDGPNDPFGYKAIGTFGEWPLTLREDSSAYHLRIEVYGSKASAAGVTGMYVVIAPSRLAQAELPSAVDHVWYAPAITTTPALLTGTSRGTGSYSGKLVVSADTVRRWIRDEQTYNEYSATDPRSIQQCLVSATVFGGQSDPTSLARLYGLHISEYAYP